jgi:hypothetical protein
MAIPGRPTFKVPMTQLRNPVLFEAWRTLYATPELVEVMATYWRHLTQGLRDEGFEIADRHTLAFNFESKCPVYTYRYEHRGGFQVAGEPDTRLRLLLRLQSSPNGRMHLLLEVQHLEQEVDDPENVFQILLSMMDVPGQPSTSDGLPQPGLLEAQREQKHGVLSPGFVERSAPAALQELLSMFVH